MAKDSFDRPRRISGFVWLLAAVAALAAVYGLFGALRQGPAPTIAIDVDRPAIGRATKIVARFAEARRGLGNVKLELVAGDRVVPLGEKQFARRGAYALTRGTPTAEASLEATVGSANIPGLQEGEVTIRATAEHGWLDVQTRPERRNAVKVLLFLDVGGSMDPYVQVMEELFSAARAEFKHLVPFYFHNCLYEGVWRDNARRWTEQTPTWDVLHTHGADYKCIFVGDASMSPYEILHPGGANEHWNAEAGEVWLRRAREKWPDHLWINPVPQKYWDYTQSIGLIRQIFDDRMVPMTLEGIARGVRLLG